MLAVPVIFYIGPTRLSPYRVVLVVTFIPCLIAWLSGSVGRTRLPDILMLLAATWGAVVLLTLHGIDVGLQSAGIFVIETWGTFLLARRYIRDVFSFRRMVRCLVLMVLVLLPFAAYENVTGSPILLKWFGLIFSVFPDATTEARWGLTRAQATFEHPILFGVVCSSAFALSYYAFGVAPRLVRLLVVSLVVITVLCSFSAGALVSLMIQMILIVWDKITAGVVRRWAILAALITAAYILVENTSNRGASQVFISYLTFNADTSYMRIHIWNYGMESVMQHPIFGVGLNDWEHAEWMGSSIDNFWLNTAVTYGVPGFLFIVGALLSVCFGLGRLRNLSLEVAQCRTGLIVTLCGLVVAMCTVHLWNASYVLFVFLLGSGMWMFEHQPRLQRHPRRENGAVNRRPPNEDKGRY